MIDDNPDFPDLPGAASRLHHPPAEPAERPEAFPALSGTRDLSGAEAQDTQQRQRHPVR